MKYNEMKIITKIVNVLARMYVFWGIDSSTNRSRVLYCLV